MFEKALTIKKHTKTKNNKYRWRKIVLNNKNTDTKVIKQYVINAKCTAEKVQRSYRNVGVNFT